MMAQRAWPLRFALLYALAAAGCACRLDLPQTTIAAVDTFLEVEIAADPHARACGLAYRDHLPDEWGMLFVLPEPKEVEFWMGATRMPLSIAFLDEEGQVWTSGRPGPPRDGNGIGRPDRHATRSRSMPVGLNGTRSPRGQCLISDCPTPWKFDR